MESSSEQVEFGRDVAELWPSLETGPWRQSNPASALICHPITDRQPSDFKDVRDIPGVPTASFSARRGTSGPGSALETLSLPGRIARVHESECGSEGAVSEAHSRRCNLEQVDGLREKFSFGTEDCAHRPRSSLEKTAPAGPLA